MKWREREEERPDPTHGQQIKAAHPRHKLFRVKLADGRVTTVSFDPKLLARAETPMGGVRPLTCQATSRTDRGQLFMSPDSPLVAGPTDEAHQAAERGVEGPVQQTAVMRACNSRARAARTVEASRRSSGEA